MHACLAEANAREVEAWLYDEDRWPSGAAGGLVTKHPKYRMHHAAIDIVTDPHDVLAEGTHVAVVNRASRVCLQRWQMDCCLPIGAVRLVGCAAPNTPALMHNAHSLR